jgi:Methenyl tetrahydrofolate cyclohydrolase
MNFTKQSCDEFISALASKSPVPSGGGASALVGAIGTALGNMVANLTLGKKKYANVEADIIVLSEKTTVLQNELLALVTKDAEVFEPLSKAYSLPKSTPEEIAKKAMVMEEALRECCNVPLEIMQKCCEAIDLHNEYAKKGTAIAISDVGVGVIFAKAALQGASLNVFINTKSMNDRNYAENINQQAKAMLAKYLKRADQIYESVAVRFE